MSQKKEVEKKVEVKVVPVSPEVAKVDAKIKVIQEQHGTAVSNKQKLIQQLRVIDESIVKLVGGYQSLMELRTELTKPADAPEAPKEEK